MKKINSRDKGKNAEREVILLIEKYFAEKGRKIILKRNLEQWRSGGYDIYGLNGICLEVKRCEKLEIDKWWEQTIQECPKNHIPVLIYRQSRKNWTVITVGNIIYSDVFVRISISIGEWLEWLTKHI